MKLSQLQEARYHKHPVVGWVNSQTGYARKQISPDDIDVVISELTKQFGPPDHAQGNETLSWYWTFETDNITGEVNNAIVVRLFSDEVGYVIVIR